MPSDTRHPPAERSTKARKAKSGGYRDRRHAKQKGKRVRIVDAGRDASGRPLWQNYVIERAGGGKGTAAYLRGFAYDLLHRAEPLERADLAKEGAPASLLTDLARAMGVAKQRIYDTIGIPRATADRRVQAGRRLDTAASEGALGLARLVGQVEAIVAESGDAEAAEGFDAAAWVADFLEHPHPALGGRRPADLMDTADGRAAVSQLVGQMQSGAYA